MKTSIQIVLLSIVLLVGCGKENEILGPDQFSGKSEESISFRSDCLPLTTNVHVYAYARLLSPQPNLTSKRTSQGGLKQTYIIEGTGDGWSDSLTRCLTSLQLVYCPDIQRISGNLVSVFQNEEVLDQYFEGTGQVEVIGESLVFTLTSGRGSLRTQTEHYVTDGDEIIVTIPDTFNGKIGIDIVTSGIYCAQ